MPTFNYIIHSSHGHTMDWSDHNCHFFIGATPKKGMNVRVIGHTCT